LHDPSFPLIQDCSEQRIIETIWERDITQERKQGDAMIFREKTDDGEK